MPKKTGKLADAIFGEPSQAAFGVFPQMKPRRSRQDPEAAKNVPVDVARGFVSGVLGAPGDIESLIRLLPGLDEKTVLPTSEDIEKRIPLKSDTPVSRAATGLGQLGGGFYVGPGSPLRLAGALPGSVVKAGKDFAMAAGASGPRIFIGPKAKTWDQAAADAAVRLEKSGADPIEIWKQTGTFRGVDGILRQEIDDRAAKFLSPDERKEVAQAIKSGIEILKDKIKTTPQKDLFPKQLNEAKKGVRERIASAKEELADYKKDPNLTEAPAYTVFSHPDLYKAYPELARVPIETGGYGGQGTLGSLSIIPGDAARPGAMSLDIYERGLKGNPTSTSLHEMQHAVQTLEGMSPGGNAAMAFQDPKAFDILEKMRADLRQPPTFDEFKRANRYSTEDEAKKAYEEYANSYKVNITPSMERDLQNRAAQEYYRRLAGEAEARAVQDRQMMTPQQRRETPPASSYDYPQEDLITKPPREYKKGGKVSFADSPDAMHLELAGGGLVKGLKAAVKATKGVEKAPISAKAKFPQEEALHLAQQRAALPVSEGGLGLPPDNTPMDRARAMGFVRESYHGTKSKNIDAFKPYVGRLGKGVYTSDFPEDAVGYAVGQGYTGGENVLPLITKEPTVAYAKGRINVFVNPRDIRSRFAAFDPTRQKESDLLAGALPFMALLDEENRQDLSEFLSRPPKVVIDMDDLKKAEGGKVSFADNAEDMRLEMAAGGAAKLARLLRAPAKSKAEIEAIAERMAPQVTGEYVRAKPTSAVTVAGKTKKQFEREKSLPVDIRAEKGERAVEPVDIEKLKGEVMIGIPGDPTVTAKTLHGVGDVRLESPAPQHGGPLYGLYHDDNHFWASGLGAARRVQNLTKEAAEQYDAPVVGKYIMMGPDSINYAQHFADANLQAIDLSKMTKSQVEQFNKLIRQGSPKSGPRPSFPGIEDKESAYLHMAMDPELRKHFNALMQQPTVTEPLNLPSGTDIRFAITEPALRDLETGVTGFSMGRMRPDIPSEGLKLSEHPTYSHDIPGHFLGGTKYPVPYELSFPDTLKAIRENPRQAPQEFGSLKMVGPRQIIDQQMIDELKAYEERMRQLTGKKKGGAVKKAAGGGISAEDLTIEERPL